MEAYFSNSIVISTVVCEGMIATRPSLLCSHPLFTYSAAPGGEGGAEGSAGTGAAGTAGAAAHTGYPGTSGSQQGEDWPEDGADLSPYGEPRPLADTGTSAA